MPVDPASALPPEPQPAFDETLPFSADFERPPARLWKGLHSLAPATVPSATMWRQTTLVDTPDGREESFSIGPDGYVWSYQLGDGEHAAGRLVATGLPAEAFAVGITGEGLLAVFAYSGGGVQVVLETGHPTLRWTHPRTLHLPWLHAAGTLERIVTLTDQGQLYVAFLVRQQDAEGRARLAIVDSVWTGGTLVRRERPGRA